jgi:hypothetical protein
MDSLSSYSFGVRSRTEKLTASSYQFHIGTARPDMILIPLVPRLLYCQHEQGSVILKLRAAELCYLREQLLINPRGGIRRMCFGECGDFFHSEFFALRPLGFGNTVGK